MAFDTVTLKNELLKLPRAHRVAFAASCSQRLVRNYEKFSGMEKWGKPDVLRTALDEVWRSLEGGQLEIARIESLAEQCEAAAPDTETFSSLYTSAALDAASAIVETLRCCEDGQPDHAVNAATSARDSVDMYIQMRNDLDPTGKAMEDVIVADPLMQRELQKQQQDLTALKQVKALTPDFLRALRESSSYDLLS